MQVVDLWNVCSLDVKKREQHQEIARAVGMYVLAWQERVKKMKSNAYSFMYLKNASSAEAEWQYMV
jgi:hypothetical protein